MGKQKIVVVLLATGAIFSLPAHATNGYFAHGYGVKSQGMGGVGIALPQDALAAASNPAGMALIGNRGDIGLTWFNPEREATLSNTCSGCGPFTGFSDGNFEANARNDFFIPEGGFNMMFYPDISLGVSIYGNGGMNTAYEEGIPLLNGAVMGGSGRPGIDYMQLIVAPTVAWKMTPTQTIGVSVNLAYQQFEAKNISSFKGISADPNDMTDQGKDRSFGGGLHFGWIGQVSDKVTLGAMYQTKTYMQKFDKYKGLFAGEGEMDIPATYGVGIAFKPTSQLTVAFDVQRYLYSDVDAVGNSISKWNGEPFATGASGNLGKSSGPGFGWDDVTAYKLGVSYAYSEALTLRAGYDHAEQPIAGKEALFNVLAPGVVEDHLTLGATYKLPNNAELSFAFMHAFSNTVHGKNAIPPQFGGGDVDLKMHQNSFGIAYGLNF